MILKLMFDEISSLMISAKRNILDPELVYIVGVLLSYVRILSQFVFNYWMNINNKPKALSCNLWIPLPPRRTDFVPRIIFRAFYEHELRICGPGYFILITTRYCFHSRGNDSWWEARFSAPVQGVPGIHTVSCTMCDGVIPGVKGWSLALTKNPHLAP